MTGNRDVHASHRPRSVVSAICCLVAGYDFPRRMQRMQRMRWAIRCAAPIRGDEANPTFLTERSHGRNDPASGSERVIAPEPVRGPRSHTNPTRKRGICGTPTPTRDLPEPPYQPEARARDGSRHDLRIIIVQSIIRSLACASGWYPQQPTRLPLCVPGPAKNGAPLPIWRVRRRARQPHPMNVRSGRLEC
jgi:hypothetical protein